MDTRIAKTLNHIEKDLSRSSTLEELAEIACLSPSQFHRIFKRETGSTPFQFGEKIRMQFAFDKITTTEVLIFDLAEQLGYQDYETFSRAFKKHFELSPDDLKAIASKIKAGLNIDNYGEMMIATFNNEADAESFVKQKLNEIVNNSEYSLEEIQQAKVFKVSEKSENSIANNIVKNKYEVSKETKIWHRLINGS